MADDKGKILDSINPVDEEASLEKAKVRESFNDPNVREEHFKQNIMMDVEEFPDGEEMPEEQLLEKDLQSVESQEQQTETDNTQERVVEEDRGGMKYADRDDDNISSQQSSSIVEPNTQPAESIVASEKSQTIAVGEDENKADNFSAFNDLSIDQEIEEAVLFSEDEASDESNANTAPVATDSEASTNEDDLLNGNLLATDADAGDTLSYSLVSDPAQGSVTVESDGSYSFIPGSEFQDLAQGEFRDVTFVYRATDSAGESDTAVMTIRVTGANDGPVAVEMSNTSVDENAHGAVIGNLSTNDIDVNDSHTYTVDDSRFEVVTNSAGDMQLKLKDGIALDHETSETVNVTITSTDQGGLSTSQKIEINVVDINEAPTDIILDPQNEPVITESPAADFSAGDGFVSANSIQDRGLETGSNVFTLSFDTASDVTSAQTLFETGGSGTGLNVVIDQGMLKVFAGSGNDLELSVPIDGDTSYNFALEVNKDDDSLTLLLSDSLPLQEMTVDNSLVASQDNWTDTDWDGGNHIGVGQGGGGSSQGNVGGDFQGSINDSGLNVYANSELEDVLPSIDALIDENTDGAVVGNLSTSDVDAGDSHSYSVNDARFEVVDDGNGYMQLKLKDGETLDFESEASIDLTVTSTDSGGLSTNQNFTVGVNDLNDAPTGISLNQLPPSDFSASDGHVGTSLNSQGLETGSNVFTLSFDTASDVTSPQTLFETGGSGTGLNVVIDQGMLKVFAGSGNDLELSVPIDGDTTYNFALEVSKDDDSLTLLLSDSLPLDEMTIENSLADSQSNWTDHDWDGGNSLGVGQIGGGSSQGRVGGDFQGSINHPGLNVYANSELEDVLIGNGSINENADGAVVGTLSTSDPDAGDSHTYSVSDARFEVVDSGSGSMQLKLKDGESLNYENESSVTVTVTSTDSGGLSISEDFTIIVNDDTNEFSVSAVTDSDNATNEVSESASVGDSVGITAFASDADATDSVTYSLTSNPGSAFAIDADTGEVTVADPSQLDFEDAQSMQIEVTASSDDSSSSQTFNISISDADEFDVSAVTDVDTATNEVSEVAVVGASVGITAFAEDQDGINSDVTYSLTSNPGNAFAIDADTGEVTVNDPSQLDFETLQTIQIEVTATSDDGSVSSETFNIAINDANEFNISTVTDVDTTVNEVSENAAVGASVGVTANAFDNDINDDVTYSLSVNPNNAFAIDSNTGEVTVASPNALDFEYDSSMQIEVTAISSDGTASSETFMITINDVDEFDVSAVSDLNNSTNEVLESAAVGDTVGITAYAFDNDASDSVTYSLSSNPGNAFAIDADTGEVTVANPSALDFEFDSSMQIEVMATSSDGTASSEIFNIAINDADEFDVSAVADTDNATNEVSESASAGTSVGITAFAEDQDGSNSDVSYSLSDDANGAFTIDSNSGEVTVADPSQLDFESAENMQIEVTATSQDGSTSTQSFNIAINDADEFDVSAVTDTDNTSNEVSESASAGTSVGITAFAEDQDGTNSDVSYSLSDDANGAFTIDPDSGEVTIADPSKLDFESTQNMQIEITATSEDGSTSTQTFNIAINDADEFDVSAVTDSDNTSNEVSESASAGTSVGITAFAEDQDGSNSDVSYSLSDDADGAFTIDSNSGEVTVNDPSKLDFEDAQNMQIEVTATSDDGSTSSQTFNIAINDADEFDVSAVTDTDSATNEVSESAAVGASVGVTAFAEDQDGTNSDVTYSLSDDADGAFTIDETTGEVTVNDPSKLDFEDAQSMQIEVTATSDDGSTSSQTLDIAINDADEFDVSVVTDSDAATNEVSESAAIGTSVGITALAEDQDGTNSDVSYSLSDDADGAFTIDSNSGEVTVADPSKLDFEDAQNMQIEVTATSDDGSTSSQTFNIAINDADEFDISAVTDSDNASNEVSESATAGDSVGVTAFAEDQDGSNSDVSYSLSNDANGAFTIDPNSGEVTVADPSQLDFESAQNMQIEVTATSEDGSTSTQTFNIAINDADEFDVSAVTDTNNTSNEVTESASAGTSVGITAFAEDQDGTNSDVSYSLSNDADGAFTIDPNSGEVTVADPSKLDFESAQNMQVEVTATSQDGSTSTQTFNIAINDSDEFDVSAVIDTDATSNVVSESASAGASVGVTALADDQDGTNSDVSYSLSDDANGAFTIDESTGEVTVNDPSKLDFESAQNMQIEVTATSQDGSTSTQTFNIAINDADEFDVSAVTDTDATSNVVSESASAGASVGITAFAEDQDGTNSDVSYSLSDDANGAFTIDPDSGEVTIADPSKLDFESTQNMQIEITATSEDGSTSTQTFNIAINDADEFDVSAVTDSDNISNEVSESASAGTSVGITAFAEDQDGSNSDVTYSLSDDADGAFTIDPNSGEVTVSDPSKLDFESAQNMQVEVTATSQDGSTSTQTFNIAINDADEFDVSAVTDSDNTSNEVNESASAGTSVGITAFAEDQDGSNSDVSYSLSDDANGAFTIDPDSGEVTVNDPSALDFETSQSMQIEVTATSDDGSTSSQTFNIAINDADEFDVSAVTDSDNTSNEVSESASAGTSAGITAFAEDQDGTNSDVSYSLSDDANGAFTIDPDSGEVTVNDPSKLDFESAQNMQIEVTATSDDGSTSSQTFNIAINDADEFDVSAVTDTDNTSNEISESASAGTSVGITAFAEDQDGTNSDVSYSLSDDANGAFTIDPSSGEVTVADPSKLNFESAENMQIEVTATSEDGSSSVQTFNIAINDADEFDVSAVADTDNATNEVSESASAGTSVGITAFAEDQDGSNSDVSYSLSDDANGAFTIDSNSGEVTVADPSKLDFESAQNMQIEVTATSQDGSTSTQTFSIAINDTDEFDVSAVTDTDNASNEVSESAVAGTSVGVTAFAEDQDGSNSDVSYSLSSNPGNAFAIDADTGEVTVNDPSALDFESSQTMQIEVTATSQDGSSSVQTFDIAINDSSEFDIGPVVDTDAGSSNGVIWSENFDGIADGVQSDTGDSAWSVDESAATSATDHGVNNNAYEFSKSSSSGNLDGKLVWQSEEIDVSDASNLSLSFDLTSAGGLESGGRWEDNVKVFVNVDGQRHELVDDSGHIDSGPNFNFTDLPEGSALIIEVETVVTAGDESYTIDNIQLSGESTDASGNNVVFENAVVGDSVGITAAAIDDDASDTVTYSLSDDADGAFTIDADTGEVTVADPSKLDFEDAQSMQIEVTATSSDGSTSSASFQIDVNDVNEGAAVSVSDASGDEDTAIALDVQLSEVEPGATVSITIDNVPPGASLSAGIDNGDGSWTLDQSDLSGLAITPPENSDADFSLSITTNVTEHGVTESYDNSINVTVDAVADAPSLTVVDANSVQEIFESTFEVGVGGGNTLFVSGADGWTAGSDAIEIRNENQHPGDAADGNQFIELNSSTYYDDASIVQRTVDTEEGTPYELNFQVSPRPGAEQYSDFKVQAIDVSTGTVLKTIDIDWDGNSVSELTWETHTFDFVGTGGDVQLVFQDSGQTHTYGRGALIDDIQFGESSGVDGNEPIDLSSLIAVGGVDTDGSESLSLSLEGIPDTAVLTSSNGEIDVENGVAEISSEDLSSLQLALANDFSGELNLGITATATENSNEESAESSDVLSINVVRNDNYVGDQENSLAQESEKLDSDNYDHVFSGDSGKDRITGTDDDDYISGMEGNDRLSGGDGDDALIGGEGNDRLSGGDGDDVLIGGEGNDRLSGGDGDDVLIGGEGNDRLDGGDGNDIFIFDGGDGSNVVDGGEGEGWVDSIDLSGYVEDAVDPSSPWQIEVDGETVDYDINAGLLELGDDVSGVIQFDDGSQLTFDNIENIEW